MYTLPEDSDPLIRGYTSCPTYNNRLLDWYTSDEFNKMSATTEAFRDGIGALDPGLNISLENWYNVYDGERMNQGSVWLTCMLSHVNHMAEDGGGGGGGWGHTRRRRVRLVWGLEAGVLHLCPPRDWPRA